MQSNSGNSDELSVANEFDPRAFRNALGCFPTGVAVITTCADNTPVGLTCNSFSSVSLDPPLVLWSLRANSKSLPAFRAARSFVINILGDDQDDLSARFASSAVEDKFAGVSWTLGLHEMPVINGCLANFECTTFAEHVAGDHVVFIGQVERFSQTRQDDPLVFYRGAYMILARSLRDMTVRGEIIRADLDEARSLIYRALLPLACLQGNESDFSAMESLLHEMESLTEPGDMARRSELAVQFLQLISNAAHNSALAVVVESLSALLHHAASVHPPRSIAQTLVPLRWRILEALRLKDANAAVAAMDEYVNEMRTLQG